MYLKSTLAGHANTVSTPGKEITQNRVRSGKSINSVAIYICVQKGNGDMVPGFFGKSVHKIWQHACTLQHAACSHNYTVCAVHFAHF